MVCTGHTTNYTCPAVVNLSWCTAGHTNAATCVGHNINPCIGHNAAVCAGHNTYYSCATNSSTACTGHTNSCPSHSGYIGPVAATAFTDPTLNTTNDVKYYHHNELRLAIYQEHVRRSKTWTDPGISSIGTTITSSYIRALRNGLTNLKAWTLPTYLTDTNTGTDDTVEAVQYTAMRTQVNSLKAECVCNCNYACTCKCNYYCTCYCNYACTCVCNYVCTCNCNYACTCVCNYGCTCVCNYCTCVCNYVCTCVCNY